MTVYACKVEEAFAERQFVFAGRMEQAVWRAGLTTLLGICYQQHMLCTSALSHIHDWDVVNRGASAGIRMPPVACVCLCVCVGGIT